MDNNNNSDHEDWRNPTEEMRERVRERFQSLPTRLAMGNGRRSSAPRISAREQMEQRIAEFQERKRQAEEQERLRQWQWQEARRAAFTGDCVECFDQGGCKHCDRGRAVLAEQQAAYARQQAEAAERRLTDMLSELSPRCQAFSFASFPYPRLPALREIRQFLDGWDGHRGLLLMGAVGTGKTGLMVSALREIAHRWAAEETYRSRIMFQTGPALMDWLRAGYDSDTFQKRSMEASNARMLAIDDLGMEKPSEWVQERLFAIINDRYENLLPTFATTNYGLDQLSERIGERIVDRLAETSQVILFKTANIRRAKGATR